MLATATRRCGALLQTDGSVRWRVWAPHASRVDLVLIDDRHETTRSMDDDGGGFFSAGALRVREGQRYAFRLDGGPDRPDPCSLWQPEGVHGPSAVVFPERFAWRDTGWTGFPRDELVFYELHVGTFTPEGTFDAIIARLAELKDLGITAIELMPVGQFPGGRDWGYDGVSLYAAQNCYGGPLGLQRLVDAAHAHGLAIFLDVIYNHLGPEGNYLQDFGPYFTDRYKTPWGPGINFDGPGCDAVRDHVLDNCRLWLEDFHFDGLRLDAVHAIVDLGARHILRALREIADRVQTRAGRVVHIIAESDLNDPRLLLPPERGGHGLDAQWSDDFHHAVHAFFTGERSGYYVDYGAMRQVAEVLGQPFLYAWNYSSFRGRKHGAAAPEDLLGDRFVVCLQNHDQVGNRARGERLTALLPHPSQARLAASLLLLSPYVPLIFMGEEYGERNPFPFFCSFTDPALIEAVCTGRRREFAAFDWHDELPEPHLEQTVASARLSWSWPDGSFQAGLRRLYRDLLRARRRWPALRDRRRRPARLVPDADSGPLLELHRGADNNFRALFNLSNRRQALPAAAIGEQVLFRSESANYGGARRDSDPVDELLPYECVALGPRLPAANSARAT